MRFVIIILVASAALLAASCKRKNKKEEPRNDVNSMGAGQSLTLKNPGSYCEKSFYCSYSTLVSDKAKRTMLYKKKSFISVCEAGLAQMDKKITALYDKCVEKKCGRELRECVLKVGGAQVKSTPAPKKQSVPATPTVMAPVVSKPTADASKLSPKASTQLKPMHQ